MTRVDFESIEDDIYDLENDVEQLEDNAEETSERHAAIDSAIERIAGDAAVVSALGDNQRLVCEDEREIERRRSSLIEDLTVLEEQLDHQAQVLESECSVIKSLASVGEDVSEAVIILDKRQEWLESCREHIEEIAAKLGASLEAYDLETAIQNDSFGAIEQSSANEKAIETSEYEAYEKGPTCDPLDPDDPPNTEPPDETNGVSGPKHSDEKSDAFKALTDYMIKHGYGEDDYDIYSKDPEWKALHKAVFPQHHQLADHELSHPEKVAWVRDVVPGLNNDDVERVVKACEWYSTLGYKPIHWDDSGKLQETQDILMVIDSPKAYAYKGTIYRGLSFGSRKELAKAMRRGRGSWTEPGITSFSSNINQALVFASQDKWGLILTCHNNKSAIPFKHMSHNSVEDEVLSPGGLRNNGWEIDQSSIVIDKERHLVFATMKES